MERIDIIKELKFTAVRSGGAGGQHVNKVSSKVVLYFDLLNSKVLSNDEIRILLDRLSSKLTKEGILILTCEKSRSQHKNKDSVVKKFSELLSSALKIRKKRKITRPSAKSKAKRLENKARNARKKEHRKKISV